MNSSDSPEIPRVETPPHRCRGATTTRRGRAVLSLVAFLGISWAAAPADLRAENRLIVGDGSGLAGTADVTVPVSLTNDSTVHAFSAAIRFDPSVLTLTDVHRGDALAAIGADLLSATVDSVSGEVSLSSIFGYDPGSDPDTFQEIGLVPGPDTPREVAVLVFSIAGNAPAGPSAIELPERVGDPPVRTAFSSSGFSISPDLTPGSVTVINENVLSFRDTVAVPGQTLDVFAMAQHPQPLQGWSISMVYDASLFTHIGADWKGTDAAALLNPLGGIEFFFSDNDPNFDVGVGRVMVGVVIDSTPPFDFREIPPSPDVAKSITKFRFETPDDPSLLGTSHLFELTEDFPEVDAINNRFITASGSFRPDLIPGTVEFREGVAFRRGYVNNDDRLDISDPIVVLEIQFKGTVVPTCEKAADANDDGRFDISDAIFLLTFIFLGGSEPPAPYGTNVCGLDPTPDNLTCLFSPQCP